MDQSFDWALMKFASDRSSHRWIRSCAALAQEINLTLANARLMEKMWGAILQGIGVSLEKRAWQLAAAAGLRSRFIPHFGSAEPPAQQSTHLTTASGKQANWCFCTLQKNRVTFNGRSHYRNQSASSQPRPAPNGSLCYRYTRLSPGLAPKRGSLVPHAPIPQRRMSP